MPELLTPAQAAVLLGIKPSSVRQAITRKKIKATKLGRDYRITPAEVARYAASRGKAGWPKDKKRGPKKGQE